MTKPMLQVRHAPRPPVSDAAADALLRRMEALEHVPALVPTPAPSTPTTDAPADADTRLVKRRGRPLADGSRRNARTLRRLTCYLPPDLALALDIAAVKANRSRSDVLADALAVYLERGE
jgi:hypothetical protein